MKLIPALLIAVLWPAGAVDAVQNDVADVPSARRQVGEDQRKAYFLIPPVADKPPAAGFGLLVILPGGDGSEAFHPFVKRIRQHAVADDVAVVQPIAYKWTANQQIVWPTERLTVEQQQFSTEAFVESLIKVVSDDLAVDPRRVYCMGWSSSGPAVYALALREDSPVTASYISMSVYKPTQLPPLKNAKGRKIYIEHSPDDRVCPYWMARKANEDLQREGAQTTLVTYRGGHGWRGDVYGRIRRALLWMEDADAKGTE